jgi:predicted lactoylglutathione lyase
MSRIIFVNLPVKDLDASKAFFGELGFGIDERFTNDQGACVVIEKDSINVMLLVEPFFQTFINDSIADAQTSREVLLCLSCESRDEVDALLAKAIAAGGKPWKPVMDQGPMYGGSFQDVDGHVWELAYMDPSAFA